MNNENSHVLMAKVNNVSNLTVLLKSINIKEGTAATVCATSHGLKVTTEAHRSVQANAFIQSDIFQKYELTEATVTFKINLPVLLDCLNIFGSSGGSSSSSSASSGQTALMMCYDGYGLPLVLMLEESGIVTDCCIKTQETDDTLDFDFAAERVVNKVIMNSEGLREAAGDLNLSGEAVEVLISPLSPYFRLSSSSDSNDFQIDYNKDSKLIEMFECKQTQVNRYRTSLFKMCLKPLPLSNKVSIRTDDRGFICMQYLMKTEEDYTCFTEYYCSPLEEYD